MGISNDVLLSLLLMLSISLIVEGQTRQTIISIRSGFTTIRKLWEAKNLDCGLPGDPVYRRSIPENLPTECLDNIEIEIQKNSTTLYRVVFNVAASDNLSSWDFFLTRIANTFSPDVKFSFSVYGFDLLVHSVDNSRFYAGISNIDLANQCVIANDAFIHAAVNTKAYHDEIMTKADHCDSMMVNALTKSYSYCTYNNESVQGFLEPVLSAVSQVTLTVGEDVELECWYSECFPEVISTQWYKSNTYSINTNRTVQMWSGRNLTLKVKNAQIFDLGNYSCEVQTLLSKKTNNVVVGALPFVTVGIVQTPQGQSPVVCRVYAYPFMELDVTVLKIETNISQSIVKSSLIPKNYTYTLENIDFSNIGNYTCSARNSFGTTTSDSFEIFVYGESTLEPVFSATHFILEETGSEIKSTTHEGEATLSKSVETTEVYTIAPTQTSTDMSAVSTTHTTFGHTITTSQPITLDMTATTTQLTTLEETATTTQTIPSVAAVNTTQLTTLEATATTTQTLSLGAAVNTTQLTTLEATATTTQTIPSVAAVNTTQLTTLEATVSTTQTLPPIAAINTTQLTTLEATATTTQTLPWVAAINTTQLTTLETTATTTQTIPSVAAVNTTQLTLEATATTTQTIPSVAAVNTTQLTTLEATATSTEILLSVAAISTTQLTTLEATATSTETLLSVAAISTTQLTTLEATATTPQLLTEEAAIITTQATNVISTTKQSAADPSVTIPSIIKVSQSHNVTLSCNVDADVNFLFWTKTINGISFNISEDREGGTVYSKDLVLRDVKWTDAGLYICHARNGSSNFTGSPIELYIDAGTPMCPCTVDYLKKLMSWESQSWSNKTRDELRIILQPVINGLRQILQVNPKNMSSYQRRLNSATNRQDSAKRIGYVGAVFLAVVIGLAVMVDLAWIQQHIDTVRKIRGQ